MRWDGNRDVGKGAMTITESAPVERIQFRLDFEAPMKATNTAEFTFKPTDNGTEVTWVMYGTNGFLGKVMGLIFDCDAMVGGQFEKGLANLETVVLNPGQDDASAQPGAGEAAGE